MYSSGGARVARGDLDELDVPDLTGVDARPHRPEVGVEAAVEADHQRGALLLDDGQALAHARDREIDRLLAEDRLAGDRRLLDQVGVHVGRGRDEHGSDVVVGDDLVDGRDSGVVGIGERARRIRQCIGDGGEPGAWRGRDGGGVDLADPAGAEQSDRERGGGHGRSLVVV
jgi:hypothetical protein